MPSTFLSMRAYEMRPEGVRARVDDSAADSMKYRSLTEERRGRRGRAHRRSRISRFPVLSNAPESGNGAFWAPTWVRGLSGFGDRRSDGPGEGAGEHGRERTPRCVSDRAQPATPARAAPSGGLT